MRDKRIAETILFLYPNIMHCRIAWQKTAGYSGMCQSIPPKDGNDRFAQPKCRGAGFLG